MKSEEEIEEQINQLREQVHTGEISWQDYIQRIQHVITGLEWVLTNVSKEEQDNEELPKLTPKQKRHYNKTKLKNRAKPYHKINKTKKELELKRKKHNEYMKAYQKRKRAEAKALLNKTISTGMKTITPKSKKELPPTNPIV